MRRSPLVFIIFIFLWAVPSSAQNTPLDKKVTFDYQDIPLEDALIDIGGRYEVNFSYSPDFIPVNQLVRAKATNKKLSKALDKLFFETQIVYKLIGNQIALRVDKNKSIGKQKTTKEEPILTSTTIEAPIETPIDSTEISSELVISEPEPKPDTLETIESEIIVEETEPEITESEPDEILLDLEGFKKKLKDINNLGPNKRMAQLSLIPDISTNSLESPIMTNSMSLNLLWGDNGGVSGFEAGVLINKIQNDVKGFQLAGLGNNVGNDVTGTQIGGLYNHNQGRTTGIQMAGLFNYSNEADAGQFAGLANIVTYNADGLQASIIFNKSGQNSQGVQAAGLVNVTEGVAKFQLSGLINKASKVKGGQIGGLMNIGGDVRGFQLAFINVSDTVSGVPIGLINIVKRGYNRFEISTGEVLSINLQAKLGASQFYNIFHIGTRIPEVENYVWGLGYGAGTRLKKTPQRFINIEAMAIQIHENEPWSNTLNMIGRFRWLWGYKFKKFKTEFFWGLTANFMISQLKNAETGKIGSEIVPYSFINKTNSKNTTNYKGWLGLNLGVRF